MLGLHETPFTEEVLLGRSERSDMIFVHCYWRKYEKVLGSQFDQRIQNLVLKTQPYFIVKFIAYKVVLGCQPIQRQNTSSKKLTTEKLSKSGRRRCTKLGQTYWNDKRKIILQLILNFILDFRI